MMNLEQMAGPVWYWLALVVAAGCQSPQAETGLARLAATDPCQAALDRGIHYLLEQQSDDFLWRSTRYGNLKDGAALTAFVLSALPAHSFEDPTNSDGKKKLQAAVDRLLPGIREHGYVTNPDGPDYSNYGSAMLLLACEQLNLKLPADAKTRLLDYLIRSQLDDDEGYDETRVDYGGWDLSGWMTGQRPTTGSNISVSATCLQALGQNANHPGAARALAAANTWLTRVHNSDGDGGFFFHPRLDHDGNKAGWLDGDTRHQTRSYGSATADGLRIMACLNYPPDTAMFVAAREWFQQHPDLQLVPGFGHETGRGSWAHGLRYYYYQSLSQSLSQFPKDDADRIATEICRILAEEQQDDGGWSNPNARMREDDPLIASGFAVIALQHCQSWRNDGQ